MADCLTPAEIEKLLADTLSPQEKELAEAHLAGCEKCRKQVDSQREEKQLFGDIKQAYQAETVAKQDQPAAVQSSPPVSDSIEGYEILREIHRGGQGVVYKAVQKATKRTVALKVLLQGPYASPRQRHRFEREIDLVASLQHPNIVTVYDSGVTKDHRHFFAMEYIHGQPLDVHLSDKDLSIDDTLRLFQKICAAVNYAHQRGVIHRDIKPGNIRIDGSGEPHVLDFGLAKAAGPDLSAGAPVTVTGEFMGTLAYASPEQTRGDPNLIDIRTDIYSLGVILYEMLTGKYPYQVIGEMAEVLKNIAEAEPRKPSTIRRQINDEVETIVLKALAKEKERRYQSAETLARDIEHYLTGEPIDAKRDSGLYVLKKTLHRYKVPVAVMAAFVAFGVVFGVSVTVMYQNQRQAREAEVVAKKEAEAERDRAIIAEKEQGRERERAEAARKDAEEARSAEAEQRKLAEKERDRAMEAEQLAQRQAFFANIGAAGTAFSTNEISAVRRHLDAVPPESRNWEWRYLNAQSDASLAVLRGHQGMVLSVAFSPNGTRMASASFDKTIRLWDVSNGNQLAVITGHEDRVYRVVFSPDGARLASASKDKTVRLWDASTGKELAVLRGSNSPVYCVAFSADGTRLASASDDKTIRIWDPSTGNELAVLRGHEASVDSVAFSPDGNRLASASWDKTIRLWDVSSGNQLAVLTGHEDGIYRVAFSPDGARLASASADKTIRLWETSSGKELAVLRGHTGEVFSVAFSPDGMILASALDDSTVRIWETVTGKALAILRGHDDRVFSVTFSPDGTRLASASGSWLDRPAHNTIRLWDSPTNEELGFLCGHEGWVRSVAFSPDGTRLASASFDKTIRLWDVSSGNQLAVLTGHEDRVYRVVFSPDGARLASASKDRTVRLWDASTGKELAVLRGHNSPVYCVAFSPGGTRLASASYDRTLRIWDVSTGEELAVLKGHEDELYSTTFSPDGKRLASASKDNTVRLWDVGTGKEMGVLRGHADWVRSVAFSPDGTRLASASDDKTVRIWDAAIGETVTVLRGHASFVSSVAFSPDGTRLASASQDNTVRLWDAATGKELAVLRGHGGRVWSVAFSPDGTQLASAAGDKTVRIWDSVPYRVRYQERQAIVAARPEAELIVDTLWYELMDARSIAEQLREDNALSEPQRRAALNLLLDKSAQLQEQVNALYARLVFTDDVVAAIEGDESLSPGVRSRAVVIARAKGDKPLRLNWDSWNLVRSSGNDLDAFKLGLCGAQVAVAAEPDNMVFVNTLGVAQYRNEQYEEACATLTRCDGLRQRRGEKSVPHNVAVLSMVLFRLERIEEAQAMFKRLEEIMNDPDKEWGDNEVVSALFEEAKQQLKESPR